jgi:alkyl hydroperoxide reductase subunit AhpF
MKNKLEVFTAPESGNYEITATPSDITIVKVNGDAVDSLGVKYYSFHTEGQGYWSKCKYCRETGLEFRNKYITYCPHCQTMFKYTGD